jgi:hypothetical protein
MRSFIVSVLENNSAIKNPILTILSVPCEKCSRLAQRLRNLLKINATNIYGSTAGTFTFDKKSALRGSQRIHLASVAPTAFSRSVGRFAHFKYRRVDARSGRWLMTSLTSSAGALADGVDRRRMLILTQALMFIAVATLGAVALADAITPWLLLILTLALGAGAAMNAPAWQATTPELVPRADLPSAVALTGMGLNLARALGPALGGVIVALAGAWAVFLLNALSFLSVIAVLYGWRRTKRDNRVPPEPVFSSIRAGIRYVRHAPALRAVLVRTVLFVPFASPLWALLPVLARHEMGLDSVGYGILFGCLGAGAVAGAIVFPEMQRRFSRDLLAVGATILFAAITVALAEIRHFGWLCVGHGRWWRSLDHAHGILQCRDTERRAVVGESTSVGSLSLDVPGQRGRRQRCLGRRHGAWRDIDGAPVRRRGIDRGSHGHSSLSPQWR